VSPRACLWQAIGDKVPPAPNVIEVVFDNYLSFLPQGNHQSGPQRTPAQDVARRERD
jgi:hypothetical protein